jgi:hypothetical protein
VLQFELFMVIRANQEPKWTNRKINSSIFREFGTFPENPKKSPARGGHFSLCLPKYALFEDEDPTKRYSPKQI